MRRTESPPPGLDFPRPIVPGTARPGSCCANAAPAELLAAARHSICGVFGVLPALFSPMGQGPITREAQRHLATWCLQPMAELLAEEGSEKLGAKIDIDVLTPLQAFDQGGSARAVATLVQAMAQAKEAGLDPAVVAAASEDGLAGIARRHVGLVVIVIIMMKNSGGYMMETPLLAARRV